MVSLAGAHCARSSPGRADDDDLALELLATVKAVARQAVDRHGGCQVLTTLGDEQHNRHPHRHDAVGEGVARFVRRG